MTTTLAGGVEQDRTTAAAYARLEERVLARDQRGATDVMFDVAREGRPLAEVLRESVRIHAPYTHVPFHQRLDDGVVKFVNNDHCLLSAGATLRLAAHMPRELDWLPMAQTVWYVPTGLDPWNQLLGKVPGHYVRMYKIDVAAEPPAPEIHWADQEPLHLKGGTFEERLNEWQTLVQRSEVVSAYRVFLGLLEDRANRDRLLSQLMFAGLIDIQDRMLFNRSYTTGHKAYRARATIELSELVGWDRAHPIVYAGVPDMGVGPHWYSTYEMATNVCLAAFEGGDHALLANTAMLSPAEQAQLEHVILHSYEPEWQHHITSLLKVGTDPRRILDVIEVAAAELVLQCGAQENYSMPQHSVEYCNHLRWYLDRFDHPHQLKLLYVAACMVNQAAHHQRGADPSNGPIQIAVSSKLQALSAGQLLERLDRAMLARETDSALATVAAYLRADYDRAPLAQLLAVEATKFGNDPHNQEIGLCLVEAYHRSTAADRDRLLLAATKHTTGHRKYGDPLELYQRYATAFGVSQPSAEAHGDAPVEALALDD